MEIKIYRDGQYDMKENMKLKARNSLHRANDHMRHAAKMIDNFFETQASTR